MAVELEEVRRGIGRRVSWPIAQVLVRIGFTPTMVSVAGLLLTLGCAYLIVEGRLLLAGLVFAASGSADMLDGAVARLTGTVSTFGGLLDSTLDRASDAVVFCALSIAYGRQALIVEAALALAVLIGSFLTSYIRARAEGLGLDCRTGLFTRPERVIVVAVGLLSGYMGPALWLLLGGVYFTVAQRLVHVRKEARSQGV
ncbi:MAG: CDP-alcohol phosphatidyltransferase family protein [Chloroflexota bacterium]